MGISPCGPTRVDTNQSRAAAPPDEDFPMEYSTFKGLQALLFFGSAMAFCIWQLAAIRRLRRAPSRPAQEASQQRAVTPTDVHDD